eukprot:SAG25_NODE_346_length_9382_cov_25.918669_9_plen_254_part_00
MPPPLPPPLTSTFSSSSKLAAAGATRSRELLSLEAVGAVGSSESSDGVPKSLSLLLVPQPAVEPGASKPTIRPVEPSPLLGRLQTFLPQLARANRSLGDGGEGAGTGEAAAAPRPCGIYIEELGDTATQPIIISAQSGALGPEIMREVGVCAPASSGAAASSDNGSSAAVRDGGGSEVHMELLCGVLEPQRGVALAIGETRSSAPAGTAQGGKRAGVIEEIGPTPRETEEQGRSKRQRTSAVQDVCGHGNDQV